MPNPKPVGNKTARRGRKLRRAIHLSDESARSLRVLWQVRRGVSPDITEDQIVDELIEAAWRQLDAEYSAGADAEAGEAIIL